MAAPGGAPGKVEQLIEQRIRGEMRPSHLKIINESHLHRHHKAMEGVSSVETHFRVSIVSEVFQGKSLIARHREVNRLLSDQLAAEGGIHALSLVTKTPQEADAAMQQR
ncbi:BolA domain UV induced protein Uvi31 [Coemansia biformis]|uniref:BolA domain UV induced protein Uvi31 n=1 Tax=Coemansia biformis TaxID=1286918 RepID=A0A9W8CUI0_9FUNG|nr:BolA domain UV induced protein Uvi31 [Coemansia biformis]